MSVLPHAGSAAAVAGFPRGASETQEALYGFFTLAVTVAGVLLLAVFAIALFVLVRGSRADAPAPQRRLSRRKRRALIAGFALVPAIAIFSVGAVSHSLLVEMESAPEASFVVRVVGERFHWMFHHPDGRTLRGVLVVPVGEVVRLDVTSRDVVHSLWIPQMGVKMDAMPGRVNSISFQPTETGEFRTACAEYCGTGHTRMSAILRVTDG